MKAAIGIIKGKIRKMKDEKNNTPKNQKYLIALYQDSIESLTKANKYLRQVDQKCEWKDKNTIYETKCGNITNIDPDKFCPYCGKKICIKTINHKD